MPIRMRSRVACSPDWIWNKLKQSSAFRTVMSPVMCFRSKDKDGFPEYWSEGKTYTFSMYLFSIIPLGRHTIHFACIDNNARLLATRESGSLLKSWNHRMEVKVSYDGETYLEDELHIVNGWLTVLSYIGAYLFFKYRHWKIRGLIGGGKRGRGYFMIDKSIINTYLSNSE